MVLDARGIPTHACPSCGHLVFKVKAMFEDYDISLWFVDGECDECGTLLTVPCPVDDPDVQR